MSMSTYTTDKASPFTRAVIRSMRKLSVLMFSESARPARADALFTCRYPEALADQSFDNTGCRLSYGGNAQVQLTMHSSTPRGAFRPYPAADELCPPYH